MNTDEICIARNVINLFAYFPFVSSVKNQRGWYEHHHVLCRGKGIPPAPEANHEVRAVIDEALNCDAEGTRKVILFTLCGRGHFGMQA